MSYTPSYLDFVREQLSQVLPEIKTRPMFGGVGLYSAGVYFGLIAEDTLYFYTDANSRPAYEKRGMGHFGRAYYQVPAEILADLEQLREWARQASAVAARKPAPKRKSPRLPKAIGNSFQRCSAIWVSQEILLWNPRAEGWHSCALYFSADAELNLTPEGMRGGQRIPLTFIHEGAPEEIFRQHPYLKGWQAFRIPDAVPARLKRLLKGQLAVAAEDRDGRVLDACGVQIAGALDALFTCNSPLGVTFEGDTPRLRVWAPTARAVHLLLYETSSGAGCQTLRMSPDGRSGVWSLRGEPDWKGKYYLYQVDVYVPRSGRIESNLSTDPYSQSLSTNSLRSQIVDLRDAELKPSGWDQLEKPPLEAPEDIVIYELHLRDFSISDPSVPASMRGTYAAFTCKGSDGMRHLSSLAQAGLTHLHLLPLFDIATLNDDKSAWKAVDEATLAALPPGSPEQARLISAIQSQDGFNWGYDPYHYSVPEGSYASDPDGPARILEFRQMVQALNQSGLRVVMDVVYNHTTESGQNPRSVLDKIVPGYYYRLNTDGEVETSTCCQNTASEHAMMRKLMIDSVLQWAVHYKVDGFRFDLMGHHMLADMQALRTALDGLTPEKDGVDGKSIYLYGEGWNFGEVADNARGFNAIQAHIGGSGIGVFNDRLRDGVRGGSAFGDPREQGFCTGLFLEPNSHESRSRAHQQAVLLEYSDWIRLGLAGNLRSYRLPTASGAELLGCELEYGGSPAGYTLDPSENVVYVSAHDNETLFDAVQAKASAHASLAERVRMHLLGLSIVMFSQGLPFFHAGDDLLRSKSLERNSYDAGDWFNRLDWTYTTNNWGVGLPIHRDHHAAFFASLLSNPDLKPGPEDIRFCAAVFQEFLRIRKSSPLFRLRTAGEIERNLVFYNTGPRQLPGLIAMQLSDHQGIDPVFSGLTILFNARPESVEYSIPELAGQNWRLHPIQQASVDPRARAAIFERAPERFTIPGRTCSVFILPK